VIKGRRCNICYKNNWQHLRTTSFNRN